MVMVMIGIFTNFITWVLVALLIYSKSKVLMIAACFIGLICAQAHSLLMDKCCISYSFSVRNSFIHKASNKMIILNLVQTLSLTIKCIMTYSGGQHGRGIEYNIVAAIALITAILKICTFIIISVKHLN